MHNYARHADGRYAVSNCKGHRCAWRWRTILPGFLYARPSVVYDTRELEEKATCAKIAKVRQERQRKVTRQIMESINGRQGRHITRLIQATPKAVRLISDVSHHRKNNARTLLATRLGVQVIASSMGARVFPNPVKEIGWYPIYTVDSIDSAVFSFPPSETVFHWPNRYKTSLRLNK